MSDMPTYIVSYSWTETFEADEAEVRWRLREWAGSKKFSAMSVGSVSVVRIEDRRLRVTFPCNLTVRVEAPSELVATREFLYSTELPHHDFRPRRLSVELAEYSDISLPNPKVERLVPRSSQEWSKG